jgi:hypothetical protein
MTLMIQPISEREFSVYALSLPRGPNFEHLAFDTGWKSPHASAVGAVFSDQDRRRFCSIVLRRRVDYRFVVTHRSDGARSQDDAAAALATAMRPEDPPEALLPGEKRRPELFAVGRKRLGAHFKVLVSTLTHFPALMTIGEVYLAMPNPDDNFVPDFQAGNLDARLWELYLLACFREQAVSVAQDYPSPDFFIERDGHTCWVEAVTANAGDASAKALGPAAHAPTDRTERLLGAPAERFAKTLRSKLQREYDKTPHVQDQSFALALADFHAPSSMVWSREALPCYLYGVHPQVIEGPRGRRGVMKSVGTLAGEHRIPAGLFRDPAMAHLSAVIFSNAATFAKFNRMGLLAGWRPEGLTMVRQGILFDRAPEALDAIPFNLDVLSEEYAALWPGGEAWCQELEVFHNPLAIYPISFDLLPGATHWFERDGEIVCSTIWDSLVLSSVTYLRLDKSDSPQYP